MDSNRTVCLRSFPGDVYNMEREIREMSVLDGQNVYDTLSALCCSL